MSSFFKIVFGSCLGTILASILFILLAIGIVSIVENMSDKSTTFESNSVLQLDLNYKIPEHTGNQPLSFSSSDFENNLGLHDIIKTITNAKNDDKIKGIYLNISTLNLGIASTRYLRQALMDFKTSDKFILAYSANYSQNAYYLASAADQIHLNPLGHIDFRGYGAILTFFADLFDNIGIDIEVFKVGKFKGAVEPFTRTNLSDENKLQIRQYLNGLWDTTKSDIGMSRNLSINQINQIANQFQGSNAKNALNTKLIDNISYEDQAFESMKIILGLDPIKDKLYLVKAKKYFSSIKKKSKFGKDKVAIIMAEGSIIDGESEEGQIGDKTYVKYIREARKNDDVKAIVLRVNSGGGSALASENIWRELQKCQDQGLPVITSMSDVAASGGYYIACSSDSIFAEPQTITGSIGVFGLYPVSKELMNDNLHIHFDSVKTNDLSTSFTGTYNLNVEEKRILQSNTNNIYDIFKKRVSDARNLSLEQVETIAQGRVWTGKKALELGLIDRLTTLPNAIGSAAKMAQLDNYAIITYPKQKELIQKIIEEFTGEKTQLAHEILKTELGPYYRHIKTLKDFQNYKGVQARIPFGITIQ